MMCLVVFCKKGEASEATACPPSLEAATTLALLPRRASAGVRPSVPPPNSANVSSSRPPPPSPRLIAGICARLAVRPSVCKKQRLLRSSEKSGVTHKKGRGQCATREVFVVGRSFVRCRCRGGRAAAAILWQVFLIVKARGGERPEDQKARGNVNLHCESKDGHTPIHNR